MTYPSILEYDAALSDPANALQSKRLKNAVLMRHPTTKRYVASTGGYSRVYKLSQAREEYALKCWIADVPDAGTRYPLIAEYLEKIDLPYFTDFGYEKEGILVGKALYPTLWMKWVSGRTLCPFIDKYINRPDVLVATARGFRHMMAKLHEQSISHGDLQDGNIIADVQGGVVDLTLIDYDSLSVPALFGSPGSIAGQTNFQSPYRDNMPEMNERMDYFSELVIYLSLRAYAEKPSLWTEEQDKRLLFESTDFESPGITEVWKKLVVMSSPVRYLADCLYTYCKESNLNALQPLENVLAGYTPGVKTAITQPTQKASSGSWDDFTNALLLEQPVETENPSPNVIVNDRWITELFEELPKQIPEPVMSNQKVANQQDQPALPVKQVQKSSFGTSVMVISGLFVLLFAFIMVFLGLDAASMAYFMLLISAGIFILAFVAALLKGIFR